MADTITASKTLSIGIEYEEDGDKKTTTIKLPNFKNNITKQQIENIFAEQNVIAYGYNDQDEPQVVTSDTIYTASTTNQTVNNLDIGWDD